MKKIVSIFLATILIATFLTGCGKGRYLYDTTDLTNYVEICDYKGIEIDKNSKLYNDIYVYFLREDMRQSQISEENIKKAISFDTSTENTVEFGDMVDIDYTGYIGETAFENGSDTGALLLIGSKNFIDNFEEQLIGAKPGQTVDVNVSFPNDYKQSSLAGKRAKFVVKVNGIAKEPEKLFEVYGFQSEDDYIKFINTRSQRQFILEYLLQNCKISEYPEEEVDILYAAVVDQYRLDYGLDLSSRPKEAVLTDMVNPLMKKYMIMYYIFDEQELELLDSTVASQNTTNATIAECYAVYDTVMNYLVDNSKVK